MRLKFATLFCLLAIAGCSGGAFAAGPDAASSPAHSGIVPRAGLLISNACQALSSAKAFTFHAEIMFDQVLQSDVKLQFSAAADFFVQRPDQLAVDYQSDLGGKKVWYSGDTLTVLDPPHMVYATLTVPSTIDGMLEKVHQEENLVIPLTDLTVSDPCQLLRKQATYGGYVGIGDVNGVETDHLAFSSPTTDVQLWLDRSGKPLPRKVVINYRSLPGAPEYIAFLSDWKFPKEIPASRFQPELPKNVVRIDFLKVKEPKP
jgi:hypothetical protein